MNIADQYSLVILVDGDRHGEGYVTPIVYYW